MLVSFHKYDMDRKDYAMRRMVGWSRSIRRTPEAATALRLCSFTVNHSRLLASLGALTLLVWQRGQASLFIQGHLLHTKVGISFMPVQCTVTRLFLSVVRKREQQFSLQMAELDRHLLPLV